MLLTFAHPLQLGNLIELAPPHPAAQARLQPARRLRAPRHLAQRLELGTQQAAVGLELGALPECE